jgi:hypothetical protein
MMGKHKEEVAAWQCIIGMYARMHMRTIIARCITDIMAGMDTTIITRAIITGITMSDIRGCIIIGERIPSSKT